MKRKRDRPGCSQTCVEAILSIVLQLSHGEIESGNLPLYSIVMVEKKMRKSGVKDKEENNMAQCERM
jgi:hypothetical protein